MEKLPEGVLDESVTLTLEEFCQICQAQTQAVVEMVEIGILEPIGNNRNEWQFTVFHLLRFKSAQRLHSDLEINWQGVALSLELIDRLKHLRKQIKELQQHLNLVTNK